MLLLFTCSQPDARINERTYHEKYLLGVFFHVGGLLLVGGQGLLVSIECCFTLVLVQCLQLPDRVIASSLIKLSLSALT